MTGYVSVKNSVTLCSAQALTGSYAATATLGSLKISGEDVVALELSYTTGAAETNNTFDFKIEYSHDASTWFQEQSVSESSGVRTFTDVSYNVSGAVAATNYKARHVFQPIAKHFRVQVKETGVAENFGTITIVATKGSGVSVGSSGNINQVLTVSLPNEGQQTMANSISVAIASDQSTVPVVQTPGTATHTTTESIVGDSASSVTILAANTARTGATFRNGSTATMYIAKGATAATTSPVRLLQNEIYELPILAGGEVYRGIVTGIWDSDAGGSVYVEESV